jgi:lambda repressor-like predicted transcriptional regulator
MTRDDRNHQWIKTALKIRRTSLTAIAAKLGVTPSTVCMVSRGAGRSRRIEAAIAEVIGYSPAELWPDRYRLGSCGVPAETEEVAPMSP